MTKVIMARVHLSGCVIGEERRRDGAVGYCYSYRGLASI
jgi:hypothetical protein